jgi:hypothetical protein
LWYRIREIEFKNCERFTRIRKVDWAGFEPATSRLRSEHYYR